MTWFPLLFALGACLRNTDDLLQRASFVLVIIHPAVIIEAKGTQIFLDIPMDLVCCPKQSRWDAGLTICCFDNPVSDPDDESLRFYKDH